VFRLGGRCCPARRPRNGIDGQPQQRAVLEGRAPGGEDDATRAGLRYPGIRHGLHRAGGDHPVVERARRVAPRPIAGDDQRPVPGPGEVAARGVRHDGVDLDTDHPVIAELMGQQGSGPPSAGADLQDPFPGLGVKVTEHGEHHGRHRAGAADRVAMLGGLRPLVQLGDHRVIAVGVGQPAARVSGAIQWLVDPHPDPVGQEQMPGMGVVGGSPADGEQVAQPLGQITLRVLRSITRRGHRRCCRSRCRGRCAGRHRHP